MADNTGGEVRLGVRNVTEILALEMSSRSSVFKGVGGGAGNDRNGRNEGNL